MFVIRIADLNIGIENNFSYIEDMCRPYIVNEIPDFNVCVTEEEILREQGDVLGNNGYLESLAVYRKISEKAIEYNTILLHGAIIDVEGCGVGFFAKSGTGKTTHMLLWKELLNKKMTIINGDKPLVKVEDDKVYAYGTPWAGKEKLQTNNKTSLQKVCFIERAEKNECISIDNEAAFERLIKQAYIPMGTSLTLSALELAVKLSQAVDFYLIRCNMEISAAEIAYQKIIMDVKEQS